MSPAVLSMQALFSVSGADLSSVCTVLITHQLLAFLMSPTLAYQMSTPSHTHHTHHTQHSGALCISFPKEEATEGLATAITLKFKGFFPRIHVPTLSPKSISSGLRFFFPPERLTLNASSPASTEIGKQNMFVERSDSRDIFWQKTCTSQTLMLALIASSSSFSPNSSHESLNQLANSSQVLFPAAAGNKGLQTLIS